MKKIGFMFAGQGAQFVGMGKDLAETSTAAKAIFEQADQQAGRSISALCFNGPLEVLTLSTNCQPAIYTTSMACLAAFREKCAIQPIITAGLSLGEYAALTAAEAIDFSTGLTLVSERGRFMNDACRNSEGAMAAILRGDTSIIEEVAAQCQIDVANYNCPGQVVISGNKEGVQRAGELLAEKKIRVIPLTVDGAFHSRLMQPAADNFANVLAKTTIHRPKILTAQNVVGNIVTDPEQIRQNLARQVSGSVRWEACVNTMLTQGVEALIEFGPGKVLAGFAGKINKQIPAYSIGSSDDLAQVLATLM